MTVAELRREVADALRGSGEPVREADWLVSAMLGTTRAGLIARGGDALDGRTAEWIVGRALRMARRRASGQPLQYVVGESMFFGLSLAVGPPVLVPRPETELVLGCVLDLLAGRAECRVADVCTGSGAIALGVKRAMPGADVVGFDHSSAALSIAAVNAARLGLLVDWVHADVMTDDFASVLGVENAADDGFDVVVSNPPYVAEAECDEVAPDVLAFEPPDALFVSGDPLRFYDRIIAESLRVARPGGLLVFEVHEDRADRVAATMREAGYANPTVRDDHAGRSRVVASALEVRPT